MRVITGLTALTLLGLGAWLVRPPTSVPPPLTGATCPPLEWVLGDFASGHWIISHTDETWSWYMDFLNVSKAAWPAEFNASDIHQYIFWTNASGLFYIMNHTIPDTHFHLLFEADSNGKWAPNPYPVLTPAGFDPSSAKVDLKKVRYAFEEHQGVPLADSCWAWRCDMPMVKNVTKDGKEVPTEYVVTFWRELTSPTSMRASLYVYEAETGKTIGPWAETHPQPYGPPSGLLPTQPKAFSYRYFRKTVQSFGDAEDRLPCAPSGLAGDKHTFC